MARVAMPMAAGFEDSEFIVLGARLRAAGHQIALFGSKAGERFLGKKRRSFATTECAAAAIDASDFDAMVILGGQAPDRMRLDPHVVEVVREFVRKGRLVAAICHGPQLLIEADAVDGKTLTSWPSIRKDLENAGATWLDCGVVSADGLITSRGLADLDVFCEMLLSRLDPVPAAVAL